MIKIKIIAVGGLKEKYWKQAIDEYTKRLSRFAKIEIVEVAEYSSGSFATGDITRKKEAELIKPELSGYTFVLDSGGKNISSTEFARLLDTRQVSGDSKFCFVIGGSVGLDESVKKSADFLLSFGKMTYPHQMMRVVLIEQIYRAMTISANITYHK